MKSRLLHHIWHHTLPDLGVDARRRQAIRAWAHRLVGREDPQVRVLRQIRAVMDRSRDVLRQAGVPSGAPVIIWTMRGGPQVNATEAILAHALRLRGVDVRIVLCDKFLPACEQRAVHMYPGGRWNARTDAQICDVCHFNATQVFDAFELPYLQLSSLVDLQEASEIQRRVARMTRQEILALSVADVQLGAEVRAFMNQFFRAISWPESPQTDMLLRRAAEAALMLHHACTRILNREQPRAVLTSHGIYLLWGVMSQTCESRGIPVTIWGHGYRTGTLRFSPGNWFAVTRMEPVHLWEGTELTPARAHRLDDYLNNRWDGLRDRRTLFDTRGGEAALALETLGLDPAKPTLGLFPNVAWDADLNFKDTAFTDMFEWVLQTVRWFADHPEAQAIVRAHPGEAISATSERVIDVIRREFPVLPRNVVVISAESGVNSYRLVPALQGAAVYGSQFGLELLCRGVPVIVVAECFYAGKGIATEVSSSVAYFDLLARLDRMRPLDQSTRRRARTYAYHYYFRRLIPFPYVSSERWSQLKDITLRSLADLLPGRNPDLDLIIEGILKHTPVLLET